MTDPLLPFDAIMISKSRNPVGVVCSFDVRSQGSREARQPWALFRNRFAVVPVEFKSTKAVDNTSARNPARVRDDRARSAADNRVE
jgi:hypothetical protein